jgi:hypothetical protein
MYSISSFHLRQPMISCIIQIRDPCYNLSFLPNIKKLCKRYGMQNTGDVAENMDRDEKWQLYAPENAVLQRRGGGASLAGRGPLGGGCGSRRDITAVHVDAAQPLPVTPLQQVVPLRRRAAAARGGTPPRMKDVP